MSLYSLPRSASAHNSGTQMEPTNFTAPVALRAPRGAGVEDNLSGGKRGIDCSTPANSAGNELVSRVERTTRRPDIPVHVRYKRRRGTTPPPPSFLSP